MITQKAIVRSGLDAASLQKRFDQQQGAIPGPAEVRMLKRWQNRAQSGRDQNLNHYKLYGAIDQAWDKGFSQYTSSIIGLLRDLQESNGDTDAMTAATRWGMSHLMSRETDPKTNKETGKTLLNLPVFYGIHLSLARSTTLMRVARIMGERLTVPLMKYEPAWMTDDRRLHCEILTQRIEQGNRELGYSQTYAEAIQAAAMYGQQLMLISEEWYSEMDELDDGPRVGKEGQRHILPHPTRSYIDIDYPAWTLNSDCGVRFMGYWKVTTYGTVRNQPGWWNLGRIAQSNRFGDPRWNAYFQTSGQCRMSVGSNQNWFSVLDRERSIDRGVSWFSAADDDQPIWITEHFEKFNPRAEFEDPKMPDCEVWFRIVMASDDTPLYVTALIDRPGEIWLYEPIGNRTIQQGLMLELMPFADHAENLLSQGILSAKQNLANVTLYDKIAIDPMDVKRDLENPGEKLYRKLNFWGVDPKKLQRMQTTMDAVFKSYRFPPLDVGTHLTLLNQLVSLMNRVVGMSDQEVGGTASHEQSAEEIRTIHSSTSHRYEYIASWFDLTFEAWKRRLATFYCQCSSAPAYAFLAKENFDRVQAAGFEFIQDGSGNMIVKAPMNSLRVEHFVAQRDGPNRIPWTTIGGQMLQFINAFSASSLAQSLPPENTIDLINEALECLQFPRSFRIKPPESAAGQISPVMQAFIQDQLKQLAEQVKQFVTEQAQKSNEAMVAGEKTIEDQLKQYVDKQTASVKAMIPEPVPAAPQQVVIHQNTAPGASSSS